MVETYNSQEFLYLKQLLCMIAVRRLNKVIKIDDKVVEVGNLVTEASISLNNLRDNMTMPISTMRSGNSAVNFEVLEDSVEELVDRSDNVVVREAIEGQLSAVQVFNRPDKNYLFNDFKREFTERNKLFDSRKSVTRLLDDCDKAFNQVSAYIQSDTSTVSIQIAIACLNVIESVDFAFSLSEDGEQVFYDHSETITVIPNE